MAATRACSGGSIHLVSLAQALGLFEHRSRDPELAGSRHPALGYPGGEDRDRVPGHLESDPGQQDVVYHQQIETFALALAARGLDRALAILGREPDNHLTGAAAYSLTRLDRRDC